VLKHERWSEKLEVGNVEEWEKRIHGRDVEEKSVLRTSMEKRGLLGNIQGKSTLQKKKRKQSPQKRDPGAERRGYSLIPGGKKN